MANTTTSAITGNNPAEPSNANVPSWAWQQLNQMAQQGYLYGVPPAVVAAVLQAENGIGMSQSQPVDQFLPITPNSSGYGLFGVGNGPYSMPVLNGQEISNSYLSTSTLAGSTQASFGQVAQVAAGRIASAAQGAYPAGSPQAQGQAQINLAPGLAAGWGTDSGAQILQEWNYPGAASTYSDSSIPWTPPSSFPGTYTGAGLQPGAVSPTSSDGGTPAAPGTGANAYTPTSTAPLSTASQCPSGASGCGPSLLYDCHGYGLAKNNGSSSCLISPPGSWCFTACEAKALIASMFIGTGVALSLIGLVMVFSRGKGLGKAAELAGAGIALIPGAEIASGALMAAGRSAQSSAGATRAASAASQHVVRQRAQARPAPPQPLQRASAPSSPKPRQRSSTPRTAPKGGAPVQDQLDAAHAQGVVKGRQQGRQKANGLSPSVGSSGSGARYSDLGGGEF